MKPMLRTAQTLVALAFLGSAIGAGAAGDKLARIKEGKARETPQKELAEPIDGLQGASATELKAYCANLKDERAVAEKELAERIQAARVAEGSTIDIAKLPSPDKADIRNPPKPRDPKAAANSPEAKETKKQVAEAFVRRSTLACLLYSAGQIQAGRAAKKVPTTKDLVKRCHEGKEVPDLNALNCEDDKPKPADKPKTDK